MYKYIKYWLTQIINVKQLLRAWNCFQLVHITENLIHSSKWSLCYIWGEWLRWLYCDKIEPETFYPFVCWFYALSLYCSSMLFHCIVAGLWIMADYAVLWYFINIIFLSNYNINIWSLSSNWTPPVFCCMNLNKSSKLSCIRLLNYEQG